MADTQQKGSIMLPIYSVKVFYTYAVVLLCSLISACGWMNYADHEIDTVHKALVVSVTEIRAANFLLADLVTRNVISKDDAQAALDKLRESHAVATTALNILETTGDPATASSSLEHATRALNAAILLLSAYTTKDAP